MVDYEFNLVIKSKQNKNRTNKSELENGNYLLNNI